MRFYFLGIAGTGMASLAVLLKQKGHQVWGTDQGIYPPMSGFLKKHRIAVQQGFAEKNLRKPFDVAVIGNALSRGNVEVEAILNRHIPFASMPELIRREFISTHRNIVITGTHGKTTTTALMAWLLEVAGLSPTFMIGGLANNFHSSVQTGRGKYFVIEGDEYDCAFFDKRPKFVHYFPDYLIINNIEYDHADIYDNLAAIKEVFKKLLRIVPGKGLTVANADSPVVKEVIQDYYSRLQRFGSDREYEWSYRIKSTASTQSVFEVWQEGKSLGEFSFPLPGEFQIQNALAVISVARDIGLGREIIQKAFSTFAGVKRRLEYWGDFQGASIYDDFAHHPTAIQATLLAMKQKFPGRRLVAIFEPRTNTSVRNIFQNQLTAALALADMVMLTPIHRLERIPAEQRLSLEKLTADLRGMQKTVHQLESYSLIIDTLKSSLKPGDVVVLLTNGNLGGQYEKMHELLA